VILIGLLKWGDPTKVPTTGALEEVNQRKTPWEILGRFPICHDQYAVLILDNFKPAKQKKPINKTPEIHNAVFGNILNINAG
jgi:hypothetical protein